MCVWGGGSESQYVDIPSLEGLPNKEREKDNGIRGLYEKHFDMKEVQVEKDE